VAEYANPARVPLSAETLMLGGLRLILSRELDNVELLMAGIVARQACALTGATGDIEAEARARPEGPGPRMRKYARAGSHRKAKPGRTLPPRFINYAGRPETSRPGRSRVTGPASSDV
jgi:hypothetical protein